MLSLKKLCFVLIPFMLLISTPVSADQASDLAAAIKQDPQNALALFNAAIANTTDPNVIVALTSAAVAAAPDLAGQIVAAAIQAAPQAAEKITQAAVAAAPQSVSAIISALVSSALPGATGAPAVSSEGNVNITATVTSVIIASLQAGLITQAQADALAVSNFGAGSTAANAITQQVTQACTTVSCN